MRILLLAASLLSLALAGCSSDSPGTTTTTTTSPTTTPAMHMATTHNVVLKGNAFVNQTVEVYMGDKVVWTHQDGNVGHTVTFDDGSFDSHPNCLAPVGIAPICMADGETVEHVFAKVGTMDYHCKVHPGMTGTIAVKPHDGHMA
jgi:plastocyanin